MLTTRPPKPSVLSLNFYILCLL